MKTDATYKTDSALAFHRQNDLKEPSQKKKKKIGRKSSADVMRNIKKCWRHSRETPFPPFEMNRSCFKKKLVEKNP